MNWAEASCSASRQRCVCYLRLWVWDVGALLMSRWGGGGLTASWYCRNLLSRSATLTLASLCRPLSGPVQGLFLPFFFPSSSPPSLQHWSFSLESPLKRCGAFVQPDKGCHSSPFPLLCGPGLAAPVEVQMLSSRRGYPRGPWRAISLSRSLSLLKAWLITTLLPPSL